jgi:hypothetical protein
LAKDLQKYERETEQVVISAASQDALDHWRDNMLALLSDPDWNTSESDDMPLAFDNDQATRGDIMVSTGAEKKRKRIWI